MTGQCTATLDDARASSCFVLFRFWPDLHFAYERNARAPRTPQPQKWSVKNKTTKKPNRPCGHKSNCSSRPTGQLPTKKTPHSKFVPWRENQCILPHLVAAAAATAAVDDEVEFIYIFFSPHMNVRPPTSLCAAVFIYLHAMPVDNTFAEPCFFILCVNKMLLHSKR